MKLVINGQTLQVKDAHPFRFSNGRLVLNVEVEQSVITHDELKTLLETNEGDMYAMDDNDIITATYSGFNREYSIITKGNTYKCEIENVSENEFQLGILRGQMDQKDAEIAALTERNAVLEECILELSETVYAEVVE